MAIVIDTATTYQTIEGFGSNCIAEPLLAPATTDLLWGSGGLGVFNGPQMDFNATTGAINIAGPQANDITNAQAALARGCRFLVGALPPRSWMTDSATTPETTPYTRTTLARAHYQDYASLLCTYFDNLNAIGITDDRILAATIHNEPDTAGWGTWVPADFRDFLRDYYGPTIAVRGHSTVKVTLGDTAFAHNLAWFCDPTLNDASARQYVRACASHGYDFYNNNPVTIPYALATSLGIPLWQTEYWDNEPDWEGNLQFDAGMGASDALRPYGAVIHNTLAGDGYSMFLHWWTLGWDGIAPPDYTYTNAGIIGPYPAQNSTKRLQVLKQYQLGAAGRTRVACTGAPADVYASAYVSPVGELTIVCVNTGYPASIQIAGTGAECLSVVLTDGTRDNARLADVVPSGGVFNYTLPALSVATFTSIPRPSVDGAFSTSFVTSFAPSDATYIARNPTLARSWLAGPASLLDSPLDRTDLRQSIVQSSTATFAAAWSELTTLARTHGFSSVSGFVAAWTNAQQIASALGFSSVSAYVLSTQASAAPWPQTLGFQSSAAFAAAWSRTTALTERLGFTTTASFLAHWDEVAEYRATFGFLSSEAWLATFPELLRLSVAYGISSVATLAADWLASRSEALTLTDVYSADFWDDMSGQLALRWSVGLALSAGYLPGSDPGLAPYTIKGHAVRLGMVGEAVRLGVKGHAVTLGILHGR